MAGSGFAQCEQLALISVAFDQCCIPTARRASSTGSDHVPIKYPSSTINLAPAREKTALFQTRATVGRCLPSSTHQVHALRPAIGRCSRPKRQILHRFRSGGWIHQYDNARFNCFADESRNGRSVTLCHTKACAQCSVCHFRTGHVAETGVKVACPDTIRLAHC